MMEAIQVPQRALLDFAAALPRGSRNVVVHLTTDEPRELRVLAPSRIGAARAFEAQHPGSWVILAIEEG